MILLTKHPILRNSQQIRCFVANPLLLTPEKPKLRSTDLLKFCIFRNQIWGNMAFWARISGYFFGGKKIKRRGFLKPAFSPTFLKPLISTIYKTEFFENSSWKIHPKTPF